jgi:hypothetical protein
MGRGGNLELLPEQATPSGLRSETPRGRDKLQAIYAELQNTAWLHPEQLAVSAAPPPELIEQEQRITHFGSLLHRRISAHIKEDLDLLIQLKVEIKEAKVNARELDDLFMETYGRAVVDYANAAGFDITYEEASEVPGISVEWNIKGRVERLAKVDPEKAQAIKEAMSDWEALQKATHGNVEVEEALQNHTEAYGYYRDLKESLFEAERDVYLKRRTLLLAEIGKLREIGGRELKAQAAPISDYKDVDPQDIVKRVIDFFPADWIESSNRQIEESGVPFEITTTYGRAFYHNKDKDDQTSKSVSSKETTSKEEIGKNSDFLALFYSPVLTHSIRDRAEVERIAAHEIGHRIEHVRPEIRACEWAFYYRRTLLEDGQLEPLELMDDIIKEESYGEEEKGRRDKFKNKYSGKSYGDLPDSMYEILSIGLEEVIGAKNVALTDPDYRNFVYGLLALL